MKKVIYFIAAACVALVGCQKENSVATVGNDSPAKVSLTLKSLSSKDGATTIADTDAEANVASIQAFIFKGNALDAYDYASETELEALSMEVSCTQGTRDIWVIVNAPSLVTITSLDALKAAVSNLTADNASNFVMLGVSTGATVTEEYAANINVDRIASRVRLFEIKRDMSADYLKTVDFAVVRAFVDCVVDNVCYDLFTPTVPATINWLNAEFANEGAISIENALIYNKLASAASIENGEKYGTEYADDATSTFNFYTYPNSHNAKDTAVPATFDQTKLIVECLIDGNYYTYPIALGEVSYNKTYDVKMLTITKLGNPSNGDDVIDPGEDDPISSAVATFTIVVNDWTQVLTFGGVTDGNITI